MSQNPTSKMAMTISSPTSFSVSTPHSPTASDEASARGVSVAFFAHTPHPSCGISASLEHPSCRNALSPASLEVPDSLPLSPSSYRTLQVSSSRPVRPPSSPPTPSSTLAVSLQVPPSAPSTTSAPSPQRLPQAVSESPAERKLSTGEELTRRLLATWVVSANASKKGGAREGERRPKRGSRLGSRHISCEFPSSSTHSSFPGTSASPVTYASPSSPTPHLSSECLPQSRSPISGVSASSSESSFSSRSPSAFPSSLWSIEGSPSREQDFRASVVQAVLSTQARRKSARRSEEQTCMNGLHAQARETKTQDVKMEGSFGIHDVSRLTSREGFAHSVIKGDKDQGGVFQVDKNNSWSACSVSPPSSSSSDPHLTATSGSSLNCLLPLASDFSGGSVDSETNADERHRSASRRSEEEAKTSQASACDTPEREREEDMTESEDELVLWDDEALEAKEARKERQCRGEIPLMQQSGSSSCDSTHGGEEDETQRTKKTEKTFSGRIDCFGAGVFPEDRSPPTGGSQQADKEEDEREGTVSRVLQILRCETLVRDAQAALRAVGVSPERLLDPESLRSPEEEPCEVVIDAGETREQRNACVGTHGKRDAYTAEAGHGRREGNEKGGKPVISSRNEEDVSMGEREETDREPNRKRSAWMRGEKSEEDLHDDPAIQTLRALLPSLLESCPDWIDEKLNVGRRGEWVAFTKILPEILERRYGLSVAELRKEGPYCWVGRGRLPKTPGSTLLSQGSLPSLSLSSCTFSAPPPLCSSSSDSRFYSACSSSSTSRCLRSASSSSLTLSPGHVCVAGEAKAQAGCDSPLSFFSPLSSPGMRSEEGLEVEVEEEARADDACVELKARWMNGCTETGLPYDIRIDVFNSTLRESIFLEVKATILGRPSFFLSAPEIQFARSQGKSFVVLALWNVRDSRGPDWALTEDVGGCESLAEFLRVLQTDARDAAGAKNEEGEGRESEARGGREPGDRGTDTAEADNRDNAFLGGDGDTVSIKCTFDDFASTKASGTGDSKGEQTSREFSSTSLSDLVSCILQSCDHA
ncbi:hypothetical protein TGME49_244640 [Toxoplasma gondii ME49]|uniref:Protein NO VEIN C-terminal domain-containing protein n=1 Tax=Toxoplasma gondii (strain ATCC 50611 / Me49) TaxID=508771 RepID=S8FAA9_TOXGM|nr:hypothetical protein TGME49_244640 [Toxoplasma gondii ME49]EPT30588.1 hypothetical protein TGME49_244640 [Toxoplasma gondii ME49]|eukprot:XP_002366953.2 hypothetical protein TGME49_244640 [Toxoplasma gondii ME49]